MLENLVLTDVLSFVAQKDSTNPQTAVKLTWESVFFADNGYKVQISSDRVNWVDLNTTALAGQSQTVLNGAKLAYAIDSQGTNTVNVEGLTAGTVYYFQIKAAATSENSESIAWSVAGVTTGATVGQRTIQDFGVRMKQPGELAVGQIATGGTLAVTQTATVLTWALPAGVPATPAVPRVTATGMGGGALPTGANFDNNLGNTFGDYYVIEYRIAGTDTWAVLPQGSSVPSQGGTPRIQTDFDERGTYINGINLQGARTTSVNIIGLAFYTTYEFRMMAKAVGSEDATEWSAVISVTTLQGNGVGMIGGLPAASDFTTQNREASKAKNFKADTSTATSITLTWDAVVGMQYEGSEGVATSTTIDCSAQFYVIRYRAVGSGTWTAWGPTSSTSANVQLDHFANNLSFLSEFYSIKGTMVTITGLTEGQEYEFQIKALAAFGGGGDTYHYMPGIGSPPTATANGVQADWSNTLLATPETLPPPVVPNAPNNVTAVLFGNETNNTISFTWTAPVVDPTHDIVEGYNVAYRFNGGTWLGADSSAIVGTTVSISLAGLMEDSEYEFEILIQAKNAGGVSDWVGLKGFLTTVG